MTISFGNQQVRKICEIEEVAIDTLGYDKSVCLKSKLSDLDACDSLKKYKIIFGDIILENETYVGSGLNPLINFEEQEIKPYFPNVFRTEL